MQLATLTRGSLLRDEHGMSKSVSLECTFVCVLGGGGGGGGGVVEVCACIAVCMCVCLLSLCACVDICPSSLHQLTNSNTVLHYCH